MRRSLLALTTLLAACTVVILLPGAGAADPGAPSVSFSATPAASSTSADAEFDFSADQDGSTFQCQLDGTGYGDCVSPTNLTGLNDGAHVFQVEATNGGLTGDPAEFDWSIDTSGSNPPPDNGPGAPTVTFDSTPPLSTTVVTTVFTFHADQPDATFQCSLAGDESVYFDCTSGETYADLFNGMEHIFWVRATVDGVTGPSSFYEWWIGQPNVIFDSDPGSGTTDTSGEIVFHADQPGASFRCEIDDTAVLLPCDSPFSFNDLSVGYHNLFIRTSADGGLTLSDLFIYQWQIVAPPTGPDTLLADTPGNPSATTDAEFTFTAAQGEGATFECSLDGADFSACESPADYSGLGDGAHTFDVHAILDGLTGTTTEYDWTIDTAPPGLPTLTSPSDGATLGDSPALNVTYNDSNADESNGNLDIKLCFDAACDNVASEYGSGGLSDGSSANWALNNPLPNGLYYWRAQAGDGVGNMSDWTGAHSFTLDDETPPSVPTLVSPADGSSPDSIPSLYVSYNDPGAPSGNGTIDAQLCADSACATVLGDMQANGYNDGAEANFSVGLLANGSYWWRARDLDGVGNASAWSPIWQFTLNDTTPPNVPVPAWPNDGATVGSAPEIGVTYYDPGVYTNSGEISFRLCDSADCTNLLQVSTTGNYYSDGQTVSWDLQPLVNGSYWWQARDIDASGNASAWSPAYSFTLDDTTPPNVPVLDYPENGGTFDGSPGEIDAVFADMDSSNSLSGSVTFQLCDSADCANVLTQGSPGGLMNGYNADMMLGTLADGTYYWRARATDGAGNSSAWSDPWSFTVSSNPALWAGISIDSAPEDGTSSTAAEFIFHTNDLEDASFECSLDGADFAACESPLDLSGLTPGLHILLIQTVLDGVRGQPGEYDWTVSAGAPVVSFDLTPSDSTARTSAEFVFHADQPGATFECSLDWAPFTICTSPTDLAGLGLGGHNFRVRATIDGLSTGDATIYYWGVHAQTVSISGVEYGTDTMGIQFHGDDPAPTSFECSLDGADFTTCTSPVSYGNLANGEHTFHVRGAVDGITGDATSFTWTTDLLPPGVATLNGPDDGATLGQEPSFSVTYNDPTATSASGNINLEVCGDAACTSDLQDISAGGLPDGYIDTIPLSQPLGNGSYWWRAQEMDGSGNSGDWSAIRSFTLDDETAPGVPTPTSPSDGAVLDGNPASLDVTYSDPGVTDYNGSVTFEFCADAACASATQSAVLAGYGDGYTVSYYPSQPLANGSYYWHAQATDGAGNTSDWSTVQHFTIDDQTLPGLPTLASPDDAATISGAVSLNAIYNDSGDTSDSGSIDFQLCADSGCATILQRYQQTMLSDDSGILWQPDPIANGVYYWRVQDTDGVGNVSGWVIRSFTLDDQQPPNPPDYVQPSDGAAVSSVPDLAVYYDDYDASNGKVEFRLCADADCTNVLQSATIASANDWVVWGLGALANGVYYWQARDIDFAGNLSDWADMRSFTLADTTPPNAPVLVAPGDGVTLTANTSLNATFADDQASPANSGGSLTFQLCDSADCANVLQQSPAIGGLQSPENISWTAVGQADGTYYWRAQQTDGAGNASAWSDTRSFTVDTTAPGMPTLTGPNDGATVPASPTLHGVYNDSNSDEQNGSLTFQVCSDADCSDVLNNNGASGLNDGATVDIDLSPYALADGVYYWRAQDSDGAGHVSAWTDTRTFTIASATAPTATIDSGPDATTQSTAAEFSFSADQDGATFQCSLDGADYSDCASPADYNDLAVGNHTFTVEASNSGLTSDAAEYDWTISAPAPSPAPVASLLTHPSDPSATGSATFTFSADQEGATFQCSLDDSEPFGSCVSGVSYDALADGSHSFRVRAVVDDAIGDPATYTWTIDTSTPPVITPPVDTTPPVGTTPPVSGGGALPPDLLLTVAGPTSATAGETIEVNLSLAARTAGSGSGIHLSSTLPAGASLVGQWFDRGSGCTISGQNLDCNLDWLTKPLVAHVRLSIALPETAGAQTFSFIVREDQTDQDYTSNSGSLTVQVASSQTTPPPTTTPQMQTPISLLLSRPHAPLRPGMTLSVNHGTWTGGPSFILSWSRADAKGKHAQRLWNAGHRASYRLVKADVGHRIMVSVLAFNTAGAAPIVRTTSTIVKP